jgi:hypothetical protein
MPSENRSFQHFAIVLLLLVVLAGSAVQEFWISRDRDALATQTVFEDGFYYLQTARNIAQGRGSVSSGDVPHNGYHPLWMLLSAAMFRLTDGGLAAIRAVLVLGVLFTALATFALYGVLRRLGCGTPAACAAALFYFLNPWTQRLATSGLEAPLNALTIILLTGHLLRFEERCARRSYYALLALLYALVYLTRTDNIFLLAAGLLYLLRRARKVERGKQAIPVPANLRARLVAAGCLALLLVLPWHVWNYARFGAFMQTSASALPVVRKIAFFAQHPGATGRDLMLHRAFLFGEWFQSSFWYTSLGTLWFLMLGAALGTLRRVSGRRAVAAVAALAALGLAAYFRAHPAWRALWLLVAAFLGARACLDPRPEDARRLGAALARLAPLLAAVVCLGFIHKFARLASREWYYVTPDVFLALLWGLLSEHVLRAIPGGLRATPSGPPAMRPIPGWALRTIPGWALRPIPSWALRAGVGVALFALPLAMLGEKSRQAWRERLTAPRGYPLEVAEAFDRFPLATRDERFGATDSGIIGFFCSHPVVNLDGVVNPEAARAIARGKLDSYIESQGIRYLLITPRMYVPEILGANYRERFVPCAGLTGQGYIFTPDPAGKKEVPPP